MKRLVSPLVLLGCHIAAAATTNIFSPLSVPDAASRGPFLVFSDSAPSVRYQQVYGSADFQAASVQAWRISEITFNLGGAPLDLNLPNIQINLSTTQNAPDGLSSSFAQNVGLDDKVVFSGPLHLVGNQGSTYGVHIPLQSPFDYDWHAGNLLMDVRNFQTIAPPSMYFLFNAVAAQGDSSSIAAFPDVSSPTAFLGTGALLTAFTATPIPEPREFVFLLLSLGGLAVTWRWNLIRKRGGLS